MVRLMARLGRKEWIIAGMEALMEEGIEGVAVESLARRLGVTKGSFYWHFGSRAELLTALLESWQQHGTERIIEDVDRATDVPAERLQRLAATIFRLTPFDGLEVALRSWASSSDEAKETVRRVDRKRLRYITDLLEASGMPRGRARGRAEVLYRTLLGEFVYRSTGGKPLDKGTITETVRLMTGDDG